MPIRWDSLLTRHVACALDDALEGAVVRALRLDGRERDLFVLLRDRTLVWRLHPSRGHVLLRPAADPAPSDLRLAGRVRAVRAPTDERLVRFELLSRRGGPPHDLVVELMGNQWNALVVERPSAVVRHVLWSRETGRGHRVGARYEPPPPLPREGRNGALDEGRWMELLARVSPEERRRALVRSVAWASPLNAGHLLGADVDGSDEERLRAGYRRWLELTSGEQPGGAVLLRRSGGRQPYPVRLADTPGTDAPTLLAAFDLAVAEEDAAGGASMEPALLDPELLRGLEDAVDRSRRKLVTLEHELSELPEADGIRAVGDLILARYGSIDPGADRATLRGFDGEEVQVELDPALAPHENAARYYDEASRIERARERLPGLIGEARKDHDRLDALLDAARAGEADPDEVRSALPEARPRGGARGEGAEPTLPYRTFKSSGGLEIRVGRGARHNDELTFKHSAPDDVWMHARHVAGAHVILRWPGPGNPPARDLTEAAVLAALHSKARTSGSVPVDWTLRKYVRKPRGAPRGAVVPDRVKTVFVRPDPTVEKALEA